jgi:hypothetical protein
MHNYTIYVFFLYKCVFIVNYLLQYVLMKFWCKLHEYADNAEICRR